MGADVRAAVMKLSSLRVQADNFLDDPDHYSYSSDRNDCTVGKAIRNPESPVDACGLDGAHIVQYIRVGQPFTLEVEVDKPGMYDLSFRHSTDTEPGGPSPWTPVRGRDPVVLPNTIYNRALTVTDLASIGWTRASTRSSSFTHPDYLSVDWLQFDRGQSADQDLMDMGITAP